MYVYISIDGRLSHVEEELHVAVEDAALGRKTRVQINFWVVGKKSSWIEC